MHGKVVQNGVTIHENTEVTGPTRGSTFTDEKPTGPLLIQGDHGPVALRNIRYKAYGIEPVTLTKMKLSTYEGKFKSVGELASLTPKKEMDIDLVEHTGPGSRDNFAGKITGTLHLPKSGKYYISLTLKWIPNEVNLERLNGAGELMIGDKKIVSIDGSKGSTASTTLNLEAGDHPLTLTYYKNYGFWYARSNDLTIALEGPGVAYTTLNAPVRAAEPVGAITVMANNEPTMLRSFMNHQGKKRTHVISVGEPGAANYTVDLSRGDFLQIWRGDFLETTTMWYGRGETQLAIPLGSVIEFSDKPSLALLPNVNTPWPDSNATYNNLGYDITKAGRPVFKYTLGNAAVRESVEPTEGGKKLAHTFMITTDQGASEVWCRVAEGTDITKQPNGFYSVNDKQYFIELLSKEEPVIRSTTDNKQELLLPIKTANKTGTVKYNLIW